MSPAAVIATLQEAANDPELASQIPPEVLQMLRTQQSEPEAMEQADVDGLSTEDLLGMLGLDTAGERLTEFGRVPEAQLAADESGFPGSVEGPADRVRHRQWNSEMTRHGLIPGPVPAIGRAGGALAASTGFEALETGKNLASALGRRDLEGAKGSAKEGLSDLRANIAGAINELMSSSEQEAKRRNYVGAIRQAIKERKITRKQGEELLAAHGLDLEGRGL
jgi:hypothetical protein